MGVSGAGKSTIGRMLADTLGFEFCDADRLHPQKNLELMSAGQPLNDDNRWPWLKAVGIRLRYNRTHNRGIVMACSALKRSYRDVLRDHVTDTFFVFLDGPMPIVYKRINDRKHEFMPPTLLASQYLSLEPLEDDEYGVRVDILQTPTRMVASISEALRTAATVSDLRDRSPEVVEHSRDSG